MKYFTLSVILLVVLVGVFILWAFLRNLGTSSSAKINPADAKKRLDTEKGIILLDVRNRDEYLEKHIPKSILIPLNVLENEASRKLPDKNAEIFVYCRSGNRSTMAVKILTKLRYTHTSNLGGIISWQYETVSGNK